LANAMLLAVLPPCSEAQAFSLPKAIQAIAVSKPKAAPIPIEVIEPKKVPSPCFKNCQLSEEGYAIIRLFEGYSPFVYKDAVGLPTIGYGHLILPGETFRTPLLPADGQRLLEKDAASKVRDVSAYVAVPLNRNQFAALTSFTFNVGSGALKSSTLLKKVNANQHSEVPVQLNRWVNAGGKKKLKGLITRRLAEGELYVATAN